MDFILQIIVSGFILFLLFYKFVFLRDNKNCIPEGNNIVSPASGKVVHIEKLVPRDTRIEIRKGFFGKIQTELPEEKEYYLVNIFMNVHNVHFTKSPSDGSIVEIIRRPGKFRGVQTLAHAIENEKQEFILKTELGIMKVIQIAGLIARRCVSFVRVGDSLEKGAKLGQILLGSQIALLIPAENLQQECFIGDKVSAGESILFSYSQNVL